MLVWLFATNLIQAETPGKGPYTRLVFHDEFDGEGLPDKTKWDFEEGYLRNHEKQYYTADRVENAYQKEGCLHLVVRNDSAVIDGAVRPITSASIHTKKTFSLTYGKIEVRAKLPLCLGSWPAIWMMPLKTPMVVGPRAAR